MTVAVTTGTETLGAQVRRGCGRFTIIDDAPGAGIGDQFMDAQSIVAAEAGLARGVCYAVLFALPLWMAIASIALMLSA